MSRLAKFFRLSSADRRLALEASIWLGLARAAVITLPFRWIASGLGRQVDAPFAQNESIGSPDILTQKIAWSIRRVGRRTPWRSNCLAKAIAGRWMLRRRQITSTIYFGMIKGKDGRLTAHAWLQSGGIIMTGGSNLDRYSILATFTD